MLSKVSGKYTRSLALSASLAVLMGGAATATSQAAEEIGTSVRIKNTVNASIDNRRLSPRDPVFTSERIEAAIDSHGELRLNDNSKVIVGENSSISLDDFVTGSGGFSSGSIKVAKGAFRFITGNSPKGAFTVETPVSTIGVRGTIFDVYVRNGETRVVLFNGEVEVCSASNCIVTNNACDVVEVSGGEAREADYLRSNGRAADAEPYDLTVGQGRFRVGWRAPTLLCDARAALDPARGPNRRPPTFDQTPGEYNSPGFSAPEPEYDPCGGPYGC